MNRAFSAGISVSLRHGPRLVGYLARLAEMRLRFDAFQRFNDLTF